MIYSISSESSLSTQFMSDLCVKKENPFFAMFKKLIELFNESSIELSDLTREVHALQYHLKEKVQKRRGEFKQDRCRTMHEMKNALTGILSCAHVLNGEDLEAGDRQEFLQLIGREIGRIVGMTEDFYTREDMDRLHLQDFSVADFFSTLNPLVEKYTLSNHKIDLVVDARYGGPMQVDVEKIQTIFMNIIYNARDAMPNGGTLQLSSHLIDGETLLFEFIDNGCGMSPEMLERLFEPFATEGKTLGTGLGMSIVKEIVDAHQGKVEVESVLGEGTTVRIWLPVAQ